MVLIQGHSQETSQGFDRANIGLTVTHTWPTPTNQGTCRIRLFEIKAIGISKGIKITPSKFWRVCCFVIPSTYNFHLKVYLFKILNLLCMELCI